MALIVQLNIINLRIALNIIIQQLAVLFVLLKLQKLSLCLLFLFSAKKTATINRILNVKVSSALQVIYMIKF